MDARIQTLYRGARLAGRASTAQVVAVTEVPPDSSTWYRGELEAIDALRAGDVPVFSTCHVSLWGELLATASRARGARGVVADAYTRDVSSLTSMAFPTFVAGVHAADSLGRAEVVDVGIPVECGGVAVMPGDFVIGDDDGVAVIPAEAAHDVIELAEEKSSAEDVVRQKLREGMSTEEMFKEFGVL